MQCIVQASSKEYLNSGFTAPQVVQFKPLPTTKMVPTSTKSLGLPTGGIVGIAIVVTAVLCVIVAIVIVIAM